MPKILNLLSSDFILYNIYLDYGHLLTWILFLLSFQTKCQIKMNKNTPINKYHHKILSIQDKEKFLKQQSEVGKNSYTWSSIRMIEKFSTAELETNKNKKYII